jgi:NH3-dependent NAD+ synthetase
MIKDCEKLVRTIAGDLRAFTDIAVIGLSGGVDSMVTGNLCVKALGPENVYFVHMPYGDVDKTEGKFNSNSMKLLDLERI